MGLSDVLSKIEAKPCWRKNTVDKAFAIESRGAFLKTSKLDIFLFYGIVNQCI